MAIVINRWTGSKMKVADDRVDFYLAAGHKLAAKKEPKPETTSEPKPEKAEPKKKAKK